MASLVFDKLTIINDCLLATGNKTCLQDDGSAEWIAASNFYERALSTLLYKHNWPFQTNLNESLARVGASTLPGYEDIYAKPADCLHLENCWRTDLAQWVLPSIFLGDSDDQGPRLMPPLDYQILGDQIHCVAPLGLSCKYVMMPASDPGVQWPAGFVEALRREIESLLYQGLNEDVDGAKLAGAVAKEELQEARDRVDQEQPRRVAFRSRFLIRRRERKIGWWL